MTDTTPRIEPCPLCGGTDVRVFREHEGIEDLVCPKCAKWWTESKRELKEAGNVVVEES